MRSTLLLSLAFGLATSSPLEKRQKIEFQSVAAAAESVIATLPAAALGPTNVGVVATTQPPATSAYNLPSAVSQATSSITVANSPNVSLAPTTIPGNAKSVAAKRDIEERDASSAAATTTSCAQYTGKGPVVASTVISDWVKDPILTAAATDAPTPTGYTQAFSNLPGSLQMMGYLTVKSLDSYDTVKCADYCNNDPLCMGFDVYYERDPGANTTCSLPDKNPPSITFIGCTLYGFHVNGSLATNTGQWRDNFQVAITASNGYNKIGVKNPDIYNNIPGFYPPVELGNASIDALFWPPAVFQDKDALGRSKLYTYMGMRSLQQPYDPRVCASICSQQTATNAAHPDTNADGTQTYRPCNFFTAYVLAKNDIPVGLQCAFYMLPWNTTYATNTGYYDYPHWPNRDVSNRYTIYNSLAFTANTFGTDKADFGRNDTLKTAYLADPNAWKLS
ncbi:hypothetical protein IWX90DRAFT_275744 [Phyllosticta citrichinensis]|uniref:Apple domain-containing protein n=1 Tax=Phyllosticta citrichinensis TaxID=1130410 RepID=A0ABR1XN61_9PEZI